MEPRDLIAQEATRIGFDPAIALAVGNVEAPTYLATGDQSTAIGDGGTSFGPFQEHIGGAADAVLNAGGSIADLMDPVGATDRFAQRYTEAKRSLGDSATPGAIAAAAQRPADPAGYAAKVDALLGGAAPAAACPPGYTKNMFGACVPVGPGAGPHGTGAIDPATGKRVDPITNAQTIGIPDVPGAIASGIESLKAGATQFAIAVAVIGVGAALVYVGGRKTLG